jgi:hypothetical protein
MKQIPKEITLSIGVDFSLAIEESTRAIRVTHILIQTIYTEGKLNSLL